MSKNPFAPGESWYGYDGEDFEYSCWQELWRALNTPGHPLTKWTGWILKQRVRIDPRARVRVSFDLEPPIVETMYCSRAGNNRIYFLATAAIAGLLLSLFW